MKFNFADNYKEQPEHFRKFSLLDRFLEELAERNKDEFSKDLYTSGKFMAIGVGANDIIYNPSDEMPEKIELEIRKELKRLYPPKMNYKEAQQAMLEYWDLTNPQMVNSEPHPHMILECIIAPKGTSLPVLQTIYLKMKDDGISNQDVLFDMGFGMTDMALFLVYQAKGDVWFEALTVYDPLLPWLNAAG